MRVALFDAAHGTAPDIAGKNLANPTAIFLALSLLLYQLGEIAIGQAVKNATLDLLRDGVRTRDLGGQESTDSFTEAVAAEVARRLAPTHLPARSELSACSEECPQQLSPLTTCRKSVVITNLIADPARFHRNRLLMADPLLPANPPDTASSGTITSPRPKRQGPSAGQVLVVTSVMFTFISFWRTAALVLCDLASTAYYIGGIVESQIGKAAPWFILGVMLFSYGVRSIYIESCAMFVRGGVYRIVKEAMGGGLARLAVSALLFDYILTGPISGVTAGQYFIGLLNDLFELGPDSPLMAHQNGLSAAIAILVTVYFWRVNIKGIHESSDQALRIMGATTVMGVVMIVWCLVTIAVRPEARHLPSADARPVQESGRRAASRCSTRSASRSIPWDSSARRRWATRSARSR